MSNSMSAVMQAATYPLELLAGAESLVQSAAVAKGERIDDGRNMPAPKERAFARAAVFTAFNYLENLLIDLAQSRIAVGPVGCPHCADSITNDLKHARAEISRTIKQWPLQLVGTCVFGLPGNPFGKFAEIRKLRNELVHPKLETLETRERTQDELLLEMTADRAEDVLREIKKMAGALYRVFRLQVPPEVA